MSPGAATRDHEYDARPLEPAPERFVIWSIEHTGWWRPDHCGYTIRLTEAGRYTRAEAAAILARANVMRTNECAIPVAAVTT